MFSLIKEESNRHLHEVRIMLNLFTSSTEVDLLEIKTMKGLFFIALYGALEYTITATVQRTIGILNERSVPILNLKPCIWAMALDSECESISVVRDKKWEKRKNLFQRIDSNNVIMINENLFPAGLGNIKVKHLQSIWDTFGITQSVVERKEIEFRLTEMADNRNAISHGRELPSAVGRKYTINDLVVRYDEINRYCSYILNVFESYIDKNEYLK